MAKVEFPPVIGQSSGSVAITAWQLDLSPPRHVCALGKDTAARLCIGQRHRGTFVLWAKIPRHGLCFGQRYRGTFVLWAKTPRHVCALGKDTAARFVLWAKEQQHDLCSGQRHHGTVYALGKDVFPKVRWVLCLRWPVQQAAAWRTQPVTPVSYVHRAGHR